MRGQTGRRRRSLGLRRPLVVCVVVTETRVTAPIWLVAAAAAVAASAVAAVTRRALRGTGALGGWAVGMAGP